MRLLLAARLPGQIVDRLKSNGFEVIEADDARDNELTREIEKSLAEVLVVRSTRITRAMMEHSHLKLIVRAGSGLDTIDTAAAAEFDIRVANCPGKSAAAVAELAFGLLLALDRQIPCATGDLHNGVWRKLHYSSGKGLKGRSIGIAGLGFIGKEIATRALAFGMTVNAWSRSLTSENARLLGINYFSSLAELAGVSEVLSLHLALTPQTHSIVDRAMLAKLRIGSYLINTARAELVVQSALADAIRTQKLRVALDVFHREPTSEGASFEDTIGVMPGTCVTPHIGAATEQSLNAIADETLKILLEYKTRRSL